MARKVILDCDPGIDDALALCLSLLDPRLEVLAVTACAGTTDADQATQNVHMLVERIDPPLMPRIGAALNPGPGAAVSNGSDLHGERGLGMADWQPATRQHLTPSDKLIIEQLRAHPGEVTLVCMGPLTGIAKALNRDPAVAGLIDSLIIVGGSAEGKGDVTPCAEFNFHFDPASAQDVILSPITKSLIPLEVSRELCFGWELVDALPGRYSKVGSILHDIVPYFLRSNRQILGRETVSFQAILPILMLVDTALFEFHPMAGNVEIGGELTRGATIFDRRTPRQWRNNMEVAVGLDVDAAKEAFYHLLKYAGNET
jgi:inosine-uridine nucleoside N-ribohydrolase